MKAYDSYTGEIVEVAALGVGKYKVEFDNELPVEDKPLFASCVDKVDIVGDTATVKYVNKPRHKKVVLRILKERVKDHRKKVEASGFGIEGTEIRMDSSRTDSSLIHSAYVGAQVFGAEDVIDYKAANGWVTITPDTLGGMFTLVSKHVEECFNREKEICTLLDDSNDSLQAIEIFKREINLGWPA